MTTKTPTLTTAEILTEAQQLTNTHYFPKLEEDQPVSSALSELKELLKEHKTIVNELAPPFTIYGNKLAQAKPQPVRWLWQKRLPLAGITLLDGDHGCGKSLLALQIAAHVSSGTPMPDGSPTIRGGVVIVTPHSDATTTQLQLLTTLGADLSRVKILSFVQTPVPEFHTGGYRPFSIPEDLTLLFQAIRSVNARLVIFDPFITLLSRDNRWTNEQLGYLLTDLNQRLIERNVACLLIRNCPAKGGHARPSGLERSDSFATIATSRLLLAPDPIQSDHLLLSHAKSTHAALTPTLTLHILPLPENPDLPHFTFLGSHCLQAKDFRECRPDTLHRRLLSQHLLSIIAQATDPIPVFTLYALSPHSSPFQIQRSLNDLLNMGQIERPTRGFYALAATRPTFSFNGSAATTLNSEPANVLNGSAATTLNSEPANVLNGSAATTLNPALANILDGSAATTLNSEPVNILNRSAATTLNPELANILNRSAATTLNPEPANVLNGSAATTLNPEPANVLNGSATTTNSPELAGTLTSTAATELALT